jgi:hypothetical protein
VDNAFPHRRAFERLFNGNGLNKRGRSTVLTLDHLAELVVVDHFVSVGQDSSGFLLIRKLPSLDVRDPFA